jgi:hypothetical protein
MCVRVFLAHLRVFFSFSRGNIAVQPQHKSQFSRSSALRVSPEWWRATPPPRTRCSLEPL